MSSDSDEEEQNYVETGSPICVFYFSHPFAIGPQSGWSRSLTDENEISLPVTKTPNTQKTPKTEQHPQQHQQSVNPEYKTLRHKHNRTANGNLRPIKRIGNKCAIVKKRSSWTLVRYLTENIHLHSRRNKLPPLEDVLNTLRAAWIQDNDFSQHQSYSEDKNNIEASMATHNHDSRSSSGFPSPVLMRRRLSAPETIMRKHTLSQQRSDSTESDSTQLSSISPARQHKTNSFWNRSSTTGSESNLSRKQYKRDPDLMRKSTLLRRMWSREFTGSISRLYNEEIFPKKTSLSMKSQSQSRSPVRSIRSSPEHGVNKDRVTGSPERLRRLNDVTGLKSKWEADNNMNSCSSYTSDGVTRSRVSSTSESNKSMLETSSTDIKVSSISTTSTEKESYTTNTNTNTSTHTRTRSTTASNSSGGNLDDNSNNSDSAYTNSTQTYSTFSSPKSNPENNNNIDCGTPKQTLNANFHIGERGQSDNGNTQAPPDLNSNTNKSNANDYNKWSNHQTEVDQTPPKIDEHTAELNIVNLSAATLNIIINNSPELNTKVQDLIAGQQISTTSGDNSLSEFVPQKTEAKLVQVDSLQKPESFYLKRKEDAPINAEHNRLIKYMISNVGAGSPYSKPTEAPQLVVPRYSALPRSISMEVNTSSADSTDKESDTASLVDSLDDPNSPRQSALTPRIKYDDKPVRGDLSALLPDNSSSCKDTPRTKLQKSQAFFVPIVQDESAENVKTVAEHLPERVRNKLSKRQQVMEQKKLSAKKSDQLDPNGNQPDSLVETEPISEGTSTNNGTLKKVKKEKKLKNPLQTLQSYKVNSRGELMMNPPATATKTKRNIKQTKRKSSNKQSESSESSTNVVPPRQSLWNHHAQLKAAANAATTVVENKVEIIEPPIKKPEIKPLFNNRIEILEIMECVEQEADNKSNTPTQSLKNGNRSKIPVPVQKSIESPSRQIQIQSIFQAYDITNVPETSPKTDQLIANILIDALNKSDIDEVKQQEVTKIVYNQLNEKRPPPIAAKIQGNRYHQKFDMIPEEKEKMSSLGSSDESNAKQNPKTESKEVEVQTQNDCKTPIPNEKKCLADASSQTDLQAAELPPRIPNAYKGKAALAMMKDEDFSTIPKGWITFYMLRKSPGSPDSSTDEGNNVADGKSNNNIDDKTDNLELRQLRPVLIRKRIGKENLSELHLQETHLTQDYNSNKISSPTRDEETKRALSLEHMNDTFTVIKKEHYTSSSESSNTQSPNNEHDVEQKSACPSLPIALPARPGRRQSHRRGRYKTTQSQGTNSTQTPGGWSVTVSGTNSCGQPAPDLEMRLKFPCPQPTSQSDSGLGEEHPRQPKRNFENATGENGDFHLPPAKPVQMKKYTVITRKHTSDLPDDSLNSRSFQYLPDLIKNKHQRPKRRDCSVPVTRSSRGLSQFVPRHPQSGLNPNPLSHHPSLGIVTTMPPLKPRGIPSSGGLKPRQTLTSYRRFSLHHSSHLSPFRTLLPNAISAEALNAADILDLPECFPAILAVTGSQISPESKPKVSTMTEKDLTRNHFSFGQHHA